MYMHVSLVLLQYLCIDNFTNTHLSTVNILKELPVARLFDVTITEQFVLSELLHLNCNKTPGPDNLVCYNCATSLCKPIRYSYLFNQSLHAGELPTDWKKANITYPIHTRRDQDVKHQITDQSV